MAAGPSLTEKMSNIQHMPSLIAATVASDKSIDGYLIRDIVKMSYESIQTRVFLQKYLTNLLDTSRNVYVKVKVLKLIVSLLDEGHPDFHRNLQKTPEPIKNASMLRATSVDIAGDCGRIRDLANKILDRLYEEPPSDRSCPYGVQSRGSVTMTTNSNNVGGGDLLLGGGGGGGGGGSVRDRIQGFGNSTSSSSSVDPNSISAQFTSAVGSLFGATKSKEKSVTYDSSYATMNPVPQYSSGLGGVGGGPSFGSGGGSFQRSYNEGRERTDWEEEEETATTGQYFKREYETPPTTSSGGSEQEKKLVDEITAPGGVRTAPTREAMTTFVSRCKSLDCLAVVECLKEKLNSDSNQTVLKSLFVIESLARSDIPDVLSFLDLLLDELNTLSSSPQSSIKAKATKLMSQLNAIDSTPSNSSSTTVQGGHEELLLLGGGGEEKEEEDGEKEEPSGLFAGLTLTGASPQATPPNKRTSPPTRTSKPNQKSSPQQPVKPVQPVTNTSSGDLLDFGSNDDFNFDPLQTSNEQTGPSLLNELTSLEVPTQPPPSFTNNELLIPSSSSSSSLTDGHSLLMTSSVPMPTSGSPLMTSGVPMVTSGPPLMTGSVPMATSGSPLMTGSVPMATSLPPLMTGSVPMATSGSPLIGNRSTTQTAGYQTGGYYSVASNRPVQRFPSKEEESSSDGFSFLSKTGKGSAFDFVKDEMKASMGGKKK